MKTNAWSRQIRKETGEWQGKKTKNREGGWGKEGEQRGEAVSWQLCSHGITWLNFLLGRLTWKNNQNLPWIHAMRNEMKKRCSVWWLSPPLPVSINNFAQDWLMCIDKCPYGTGKHHPPVSKVTHNDNKQLVIGHTGHTWQSWKLAKCPEFQSNALKKKINHGGNISLGTSATTAVTTITLPSPVHWKDLHF